MGSVISATSPWIANASLTSPEARLALGALLGSSPTSTVAVEGGVFPAPGDPFRPTSNGTASAPRVSVAPGQLSLQRPSGGPYIGTLAAAGNVSLDLPLPSSGQTRIDVLVARIVDTEADGGATNPPTFYLELLTLTGAPSSSPIAPTPDAGQIPLFRMTVSSSGAITNVVSMRPWTRAAGAPRFVEPGDTRAGSFAGDMRVFATGQVDIWLFVDSTWQWQMLIPAPLDGAVAFTVNSSAYTPQDSTRPLRGFVDSRGAVRLAGFIRRTGANTNIAAFTQYQLTTDPLPVSLRPTGIRDMIAAASWGPVCLTVRPNGHLFFMSYVATTLVQNTTWWSFDGATYQRA